MSLTLDGMQKQVDERVNKHPDRYRTEQKIFEKLKEEQQEMKDALIAYQNSPTEENLKAFKTEIGDELFALICLANKLGMISMEECFNLMIDKNKERAKNDYKKQ